MTTQATTTEFDVLVIGGGISGINTSYRLQENFPNSTFAVLESRHEIGGTWSLFKYPGIRSDSDLHTFGFPFHPWKSSNSIASGESILSYMKETVDKFGLEKYFRFGHKVKSADWRPEEQRWRLEVEVKSGQNGETQRRTYYTKWLIMGTGYYSYDRPAEPVIPGLEDFQGKRVHPQFWPQDLNVKDKKVVVIGSGATAITLMPALVDEGAKQVTQLQRSPSYVMGVPQQKPEDKNWFQRWAPQWMVERWTRKCKRFAGSLPQLTDIYRIRTHSRPHTPLQVLHVLPRTRPEDGARCRAKATTSRLRNEPTSQAWLQPLGTTHVLLSRWRLLQGIPIGTSKHCDRHNQDGHENWY